MNTLRIDLDLDLKNFAERIKDNSDESLFYTRSEGDKSTCLASGNTDKMIDSILVAMEEDLHIATILQAAVAEFLVNNGFVKNFTDAVYKAEKEIKK